VDATQTQPGGAIGHGEVESELRRLAVRQVGCLWGRTVHRLDALHWRVGGSEPVRLLVAVDLLMRRRRLAFSPAAGQDTENAFFRR
jgi:hypothetical protein